MSSARPTTTVLLVDDSEVMRQVLRMYLESSDDDWDIVGEATDGLESIARCDQSCPDVIVLDQQMPYMNGVDALPRLRTACPAARIVMWSSSPEVEAVARSRGADAFIDKARPLDDVAAAMLGAAP